MTAVHLGTYQHHSPEWYAARDGRIGGSEVAAILGLSRFDSLFSLWASKKGLAGERVENDEMRAGMLLEPIILQEFRRKHPDLAVVSNVGSWVHEDRPWQLANPDGLVMLPRSSPAAPVNVAAVVECKFSLFGDDFGADGSDEIPPYYRCQVQWYCDVFGAPGAWVEVFIGARGEFRTYWVPADPGDQALLRVKAREFLTLLASDRQPPLDGSDATYQTVRRMHPDIDGTDIEIDPGLVDDYLGACETLKDAKSGLQFCAARLMQAMGTARYATVAGERLVRREAKGDAGVPYLKTCQPRRAAA